MYSQFKKSEAHPMEKYIGRLVNYRGEKLEVVGYSTDMSSPAKVIVDGTKIKAWGWRILDAGDVVFKECERYWYICINNLMD